MKRSLVGIMAGLAVATAMDASAAGKDEILVDREAGTISRIIRSPKSEEYPNSYAPHREMLSCKYAYIAVTRGHDAGIHTIDLLVGLQGPKANDAVEKRVAAARAECNKNGLKPEF